MILSIEHRNDHDEAEMALLGLMPEARLRPRGPREPLATTPDSTEALERHDTIPAPPPWLDEVEYE
jgi:hypothetical protein